MIAPEIQLQDKRRQHGSPCSFNGQDALITIYSLLMPLSPEWRSRLFISGALLLGVLVSSQIAEGSFVAAVAIGAAVVALVLARVQPVRLEVIAVGVVLAGYIIGNRGFAQISLVPGLPLLPAECALAAATCALVLRSAVAQDLPIRRDPLNVVLLAWIVVGVVRVTMDIRTHGFWALRDFALVYYAVFFFVAQQFAREDQSRRFLLGAVFVSTLLLLILQPLVAFFPDFFAHRLTVRGIPLVLYKGDLLAASLAVTGVLYYLRYEERRHWLLLLISLLAFFCVVGANSRAALLSLVVAVGLLAIGGRWKLGALLFGGGVIGAFIIVIAATFQGRSWRSTPVYDFYERAVSVADPFGERTYRGENTSDKGENNAFRTVWWKVTTEETIEANPITGLGFGHDLAKRFLDRYYPINDDDFTVRSPHNVLVTVFARMGLIGLLPFLALIFLILRQTLRAVRQPRGRALSAGLWCSVCLVLTSACFGVVLEGPMGAMLFWTLLGLAHHELQAERSGQIPDTQPQVNAPETAQAQLQTPGSTPERA